MYFVFFFLRRGGCFGLIECLLHKPAIPLQARKCFLTQKHQQLYSQCFNDHIHIYIAHRFYSVQMENVQTLTIFKCSLSNKRYLPLSFIAAKTVIKTVFLIVGIFMYYTDLHTLI